MRFSLRLKLILAIVVPVLVVYGVLSGYGVRDTRARAVADAQRWLQEHAGHQAARAVIALNSLEMLAGSLRDAALGAPDASRERLAAYIMDGLRRTPLARAAAVIDTAHPQGVHVVRGSLATGVPAELLAQEARGGWSHGDAGGGFVRYTLPIRARGDVRGRVLVEMHRDSLLDLLARRHIQGIELHLRDAAGRLVFAALAGIDAALPPVAGNAVGNAVEVQRWRGRRQPHWLAISPLARTGWQMVAVVSEQRVLAEVQVQADRASVLLVLALLLIVSIIAVAASRITRPLRELDSAVHEIAGGNFAVAPRVRSRDELGGLAGAIGFMARRIEMRERELTQAREALERRVDQRTAELAEANRRLARQVEETRQTEEALRGARDQAEEASRAKSEFLSNMSHELRTPLNGVLGYAQIMRRDTEISQRQRENLEAIESCGQHLLTLINDVLDLSKIEAGRMSVDLAPVHLERLLKGVHDIVVQRAQSKGLQLEMSVAADLPLGIRTDAIKLRQILLNLLGNAVKFTESGHVGLHVACRGERLEFVIEDTGIGIPEDKMGVIFDAFRQAEAGMVIGGTGLGLAINGRLLELLGGTQLEVSSELGVGSRFSFTLPLEAVDEAELPDEETATFDDSGTLRLAEGQTLEVMVVDDRPENRDILQRLLVDAGFTVVAFADAPSALAALAQRPLPLVLMDIRMPGMNGIEAVRRIRGPLDLREVCVIAVTASVFPELREQLAQTGFDDFIGKPFRSGELFRMIQKHTGVVYAGDGEQAAAVTGGAADTWPAQLAHEVAGAIEAAVDMGDITSLAELATGLRGAAGAPPGAADKIDRLARQFDFAALSVLADTLRREAEAGA